MSRAFPVAVVSLLLLSCSQRLDEDAWKARGAAAVTPFKKELQAALVEGLAEGPQEAITACRVEAPRIANAFSSGGIKVGRTSHKLRNPKNRPKDWMVPLLERYRVGATEPMVVVIDKQTVGYVEPIMLKSLCVTCHGSAIPEAIAAKLAKLYPSDAATDFEVGDFRGVFWAELRK